MNLQLAQKIVNKTLLLAETEQLGISVAVTDSHGELVCFSRTNECSFHAGLLAQNKAYTAARDRQPSRALSTWAKATGKDMGYWTDAKFTGIAGGLPILRDGRVIGAIGISGLSEDDDETLAARVLQLTTD